LCSLKLSDVNLELESFMWLGSKGAIPIRIHSIGESAAIRVWLAERAKLNPPAEVDTLYQ
jgi:hypothetical protein